MHGESPAATSGDPWEPANEGSPPADPSARPSPFSDIAWPRTWLLLGLALAMAAGLAWWREGSRPWRAYQASAHRLQADLARADLQAAGSAVQRLDAQSRLDAAQSAGIAVVSLIPSQTGKPEVCLTCHLGMEEISPSHPAEAFGCVVCHGGDGLSLDAIGAHAGMRGGRNPARLDVAAQSCGQTDCHGGYPETGPGGRNAVDRVSRSLQATYASGIALVRYTFGAQPSQAPIYGLRAVTATGAVDSPALSRLDALPPGASGSIDQRFRSSCLEGGCHLWTAPRQNAYFFRGEGCSVCHVTYALDGRYRASDAMISRSEPGHPAAHRFTSAIPYSTCNACHNRGNYDVATLSFAERDDLDPAGLAAQPAPQRRLSEYYQPIGEFTLCEWVLDCIDCHTAGQVMGDGHIYGRMQDSQSTRCYTCHGTLKDYAPVAPVADKDAPAIRQARVNGNYAVAVGDLLAVNDKGEDLPNVKKVGGNLILTRKVTGQQYVIPQVKGSACTQEIDAQASAACHVCHAVKR